MKCIPIIGQRKSIRSFEETPLDPEALTRVLEAARLAPSAKNRQSWRFIVAQDPQLRRRIQPGGREIEFTRAYRVLGAGDHLAFDRSQALHPAVIAACTTNIDYRMPNGQLSYPIDLSFAVASMMFQAQAEGWGTCVITTFSEAELKEIFTVPYSMRVVMLLLVGVPKETESETPRKPLDQIVSYDHW